MKKIEIKNDIIAYEQVGNIESPYTLLFIHGAAMTKAGMVPIAECFKQYNCIVVDLPSHGESTGNIPKDITGYVEYVEALIQELTSQGQISSHLTVVGYSMGGAITYELALRKKIKIDRMVILSSGADLADTTPLVDKVIEETKEKFNAIDFFVYAFGQNTTEEQKAIILDMLNQTKVDDAIGYEDLAICKKYNKLNQAVDIKIPTIIIHGNDDQIVLPISGMNLRKYIKDSVLVMLPYRGHTAIFEEPGFVVEKIEDFFAKTL